MEPLLALTLTGQSVAVIALALLAGGMGAKLLTNKSAAVEQLKAEADDVANKLALRHFPHLAEIVRKFALGDIAGGIALVKALAQIARDPAQFDALLEAPFWATLRDKLADEAEFQAVLDEVAAAAAVIQAHASGQNRATAALAEFAKAVKPA